MYNLCTFDKNYIMIVDIVLDKRRAKKSGKYGVKIRVTHRGIQKYYVCKAIKGYQDN